MGKLEEFSPIFFPRSHAIIGASNHFSKFGGMYFRSQIAFGYKGILIPVNPNEPEVGGLKAYPKVTDIPGLVDFASILVPSKSVPQVLAECLEKRIPAVQIITAGFSELNEEGKSLENQIKEIVSRGIRVIGPNCFGIYSPSGGVTVMPGGDLPKEGGSVAFISQSGGYATRIPRRAEGLGIRFSKVVSYGNAADINECDLLEYLNEDPDTQIITSYLEGVKNGPRFLTLLKKLCRKKPVIVWKGGLTESGAYAVQSHTASLSGSSQIWDAVFKQTGAIRVNSLEELLDTVLAFQHLPMVKDNRVCIISGGGGIGVAAADACERTGAVLPMFSKETQRKLAQVAPAQGASMRNPVDIGSPFPLPQMLAETIDIVFSDTNIDAIILDELEMTPVVRDGKNSIFSEQRFGPNRQIPIDMKNKHQKPIILVLPVEGIGVDFISSETDRRRIVDNYSKLGIPCFLSLERATSAFSRFANYCKFRREKAI